MKRFVLIISSIFLFVPEMFSYSGEIQKALNFYAEPKDSLKRKALLFLINNMDIHFSETYFWKDTHNHKIPFDEFAYPTYAESEQAFKLLSKNNKLTPEIVIIPDSDMLTAIQLQETIETAFRGWQKPWNRDLSFSDFCNYLLPYRIQNELLEDWRKSFTRLLPQGNYTSALKLCSDINKRLSSFKGTFGFEKRGKGQTFLSPRQMLFRWQGHCQDQCHLSVYAMRLAGLPVTVDFTPYWATSTGGHLWCRFIQGGTRPSIPFEGGYGNPGDFILKREPSKVFRITYSKQSAALASKLDTSFIPDGHLRMFNIKDVTHLYWRTANMLCRITGAIPSGIVYATVFNGMKWKPADWGKVENGSVLFTNMSVGAIYLPMRYLNGRLTPAGVPCLLQSDRSVTPLHVNSHRRITIMVPETPGYLFYQRGIRYRLFYWDKVWKVAGYQIATSAKTMSFENVPSGTLYLLVPENSQQKERPFTINDQGVIMRW